MCLLFALKYFNLSYHSGPICTFCISWIHWYLSRGARMCCLFTASFYTTAGSERDFCIRNHLFCLKCTPNCIHRVANQVIKLVQNTSLIPCQPSWSSLRGFRHFQEVISVSSLIRVCSGCRVEIRHWGVTLVKHWAVHFRKPVPLKRRSQDRNATSNYTPPYILPW